MKLIFEIYNRYLQLETGDINEPVVVEDDEPEEIETVRLPLGFQAPPKVEVFDDDDETPEADCI